MESRDRSNNPLANQQPLIVNICKLMVHVMLAVDRHGAAGDANAEQQVSGQHRECHLAHVAYQ